MSEWACSNSLKCKEYSYLTGNAVSFSTVDLDYIFCSDNFRFSKHFPALWTVCCCDFVQSISQNYLHENKGVFVCAEETIFEIMHTTSFIQG